MHVTRVEMPVIRVGQGKPSRGATFLLELLDDPLSGQDCPFFSTSLVASDLQWRSSPGRPDAAGTPRNASAMLQHGLTVTHGYPCYDQAMPKIPAPRRT